MIIYLHCSMPPMSEDAQEVFGDGVDDVLATMHMADEPFCVIQPESRQSAIHGTITCSGFETFEPPAGFYPIVAEHIVSVMTDMYQRQLIPVEIWGVGGTH